MDQALDARLYLNESPKIGDPGHNSMHAISSLQPCRHTIPRMRKKLLHAHRDALLRGINFDYPGLDLLSYGEHVFRLVDAAPGDIANMEQRVHSAYIDKRAIAG